MNYVILGKNNTETINHNVTQLEFLQEIMSRQNKQLEIENISNEYANVLSELEININKVGVINADCKENKIISK